MKKRTVIASITAFAISMSLSACGSTPTASNNSDSTRIEELEQRIEELETENKELKVQLNNSDSSDSNQQSTNEAESLLQTTIESPETSGVCGANLTWYYQNGVLAITGTGEMTDYSSVEETPWFDLKDKIGWVIIDEGATTVGENAFYKFSTLSKVELPDTLTVIKENAFYECENLQEITFPVSLTSIGDDAFYNCKNIKEYNFKCDMPEGIYDAVDWAREPVYAAADPEIAAVDPEYAARFEVTEEERLRDKGELYLYPMTIYYSGTTFDEYISSYPYWSDYGVEWIKQ